MVVRVCPVQSGVTWPAELVLGHEGAWWIHLACTESQPAPTRARRLQRWDHTARISHPTPASRCRIDNWWQCIVRRYCTLGDSWLRSRRGHRSRHWRHRWPRRERSKLSPRAALTAYNHCASHGRRNRGLWGDIVPPLLGPGGTGRYNENDLPGD